MDDKLCWGIEKHKPRATSLVSGLGFSHAAKRAKRDWASAPAAGCPIRNLDSHLSFTRGSAYSGRFRFM